MSVDIMSAVWKMEVGSHTAKLVLMSLADNANDAGVCWPSISKIMRRCELSRQGVFDQLSKLEKQGLLVRQKGGSGRSNTYTIPIPEVVNGVDGGSQRRGPSQSTAWTGVVNGVDPNHHRTQNEPTSNHQPAEPVLALERMEQDLPAVRPRAGTVLAVEVMPERRLKAAPIPEAPLEFPEALDTDAFRAKWETWEKVRRAMKKPKSWRLLFQEQLVWLATYEESVAIEIVSASIRNGWQGLFEPKVQRNGHNGSVANGNGNLSGMDKMIIKQEIENARAEIKAIHDSRESHSSLSVVDVAMLKHYRQIEAEGMKKLGMRV